MEDFAVVVEALTGPILLYDFDRLGGALAPFVHGDFAALELARVVAADTDGEQDAPLRLNIEARKLLCHHGGVPQRQKKRGGSDFDARRQRRSTRQRGHGFENRAVIDDVLSRPERVISEFLDRTDVVITPQVATAGDSEFSWHGSSFNARYGALNAAPR